MPEYLDLHGLTLRRCTKSIPGSIRHPRFKVSMRLSSARIGSLKSDIKSIDIRTDDAEGLPEEVYFDIYENKNCSSERRGWTETLSLTKTVSLNRSATLSKTLSTTNTIGASVNFPVGIGVNGSVTRNVSFTQSSSWSETETVNESRSRTINLEVRERSILYVKLKRVVKRIKVPMTADITVDGTVVATYKGTYRIYYPPVDDFPADVEDVDIEHKITYRISDLISKKQRTYSVDGYLTNASAEDISVEYDERELSDEECEAVDTNTPLLMGAFVHEDDGLRSREADYKDLSFGLVIDEYFSSTRIETSNSIANIEVRHLSFGPGFCDVETRSSLGGVSKTLAPPAIWGPWGVLESHIGEVGLTITNTVNCDTGVRSQVRYWKK